MTEGLMLVGRLCNRCALACDTNYQRRMASKHGGAPLCTRVDPLSLSEQSLLGAANRYESRNAPHEGPEPSPRLCTCIDSLRFSLETLLFLFFHSTKRLIRCAAKSLTHPHKSLCFSLSLAVLSKRTLAPSASNTRPV